MFRALVFLIPLFFLLQGATARPWQKYLVGKPLDVKIPPLQKTTLPGGIDLYYIQNSLVPSVNFTVVVEGGSFEERQQQQDLTKLWGETIVLGGSDKYDRKTLAGLLEQNAARFSFDAGFERSTFSFSSLSNFYLEGLEKVLQVLQNPRFHAEDFTIVQKQLLQAIKKRKENPARLAFIAAQRKAYQGSVRGLISTQKSVEKLGLPDLKKWHQKMMVNRRISLVVSGDFDLDALKALCTRGLQGMKSGQPVDSSPLQKESNYPALGRHLFHIEKKIPQSTILMSSAGIAHSSEEYFAMKLFDFILGGDAFNSHLMQQIRVKEGWAYSVYSFLRAGRYPGNINVFSQSANKNVPDVIARFKDILSNPAAFVTEQRLAQAKQSLTNKYVFLYETPGELASLHLSLMYDGLKPSYLDTYLQRLQAVTLEQVLAVAGKYYQPGRFFTVVVGPDKVWQKAQQNPAGTVKVEQVEIPL